MDSILTAIGFLIINAPAALTCAAWIVYVRNRAGLTKGRRLLVILDLAFLTASILWWYLMPLAVHDVTLDDEWGRFVTFGWTAVGLAVSALILSLAAKPIAKGALTALVMLSAIGANLLWMAIGFYPG